MDGFNLWSKILLDSSKSYPVHSIQDYIKDYKNLEKPILHRLNYFGATIQCTKCYLEFHKNDIETLKKSNILTFSELNDFAWIMIESKLIR